MAVALGGYTVDRPGDRVAVVTGSGPVGATVLAARCLDQRITAITLTAVAAEGSADPAPLWRIESAKGSIGDAAGALMADHDRGGRGRPGPPAAAVTVGSRWTRP